jgi:hypothetical protein
MPPKVGRFASKSKAAARPKAAAKQKAAATTPRKRKSKKTQDSPAGSASASRADSPPAKQRSPASDTEQEVGGASSSSAAAASSSGHFVAEGGSLELAVYEVDDSSNCSMCEKHIKDNDYVVMSRRGTSEFKKCGPCNRLQNRVQRTLMQRGDLKDRWSVMNREQRKHFFQEHHAAMGSDVALRITQSTTHTFSSSQQAGFATKGDWMDTADLDKLYEGKPDQLKSIKENCKKMLCPLRGVELLQHITYNSMTNDQQKSEINRTITMAQERALKASKKPKAIVAGPKAEPGGPPKLSVSAIAKLQALRETMETLGETMKTKGENCAEDVPKKILCHMQLKRAEMTAIGVEIDGAIEIGRGKISEVLTEAKTAMKAAQAALVTVSNLTDTLEAMS